MVRMVRMVSIVRYYCQYGLYGQYGKVCSLSVRVCRLLVGTLYSIVSV